MGQPSLVHSPRAVSSEYCLRALFTRLPSSVIRRSDPLACFEALSLEMEQMLAGELVAVQPSFAPSSFAPTVCRLCL